MSSELSQEPDTRFILVSSCLLGLPTRYDGKSKTARDLPLDGAIPIAVCPEMLGGLPCPRPKNMLTGGDGFAVLKGNAVVMDESGKDVTSCFIRGAELSLKLALEHKATSVFLKSKSPSCGCGKVYIDGVLKDGYGVTSALLFQHGITCIEID